MLKCSEKNEGLEMVSSSPAELTISQLMPKWTAALAAANSVSDRADEAINTAVGLYPEAPRAICDTRGRHMMRSEVEERDRYSHSGALAVYDRWIAQCKAIAAGLKVPEFTQRENDAWGDVQAIGGAIMALRPRNAGEAECKFRVLLNRCSDGKGGIDDSVPIVAFAEDLKHLADASLQHDSCSRSTRGALPVSMQTATDRREHG